VVEESDVALLNCLVDDCLLMNFQQNGSGFENEMVDPLGVFEKKMNRIFRN